LWNAFSHISISDIIRLIVGVVSRAYPYADSRRASSPSVASKRMFGRRCGGGPAAGCDSGRGGAAP
jgi:hypothetical protein